MAKIHYSTESINAPCSLQLHSETHYCYKFNTSQVQL